MVGLMRLCLVSDKFLCMVRKSVGFLVDRSGRSVTMSRGYGGICLITTSFRAFLFVLDAFPCRSNCAAGEVAREITCVTTFSCVFWPSWSPAAKMEQRGGKKKTTVRGENTFSNQSSHRAHTYQTVGGNGQTDRRKGVSGLGVLVRGQKMVVFPQRFPRTVVSHEEKQTTILGKVREKQPFLAPLKTTQTAATQHNEVLMLGLSWQCNSSRGRKIIYSRAIGTS